VTTPSRFTERPEDLVVQGLTNHEPVGAQERSMATVVRAISHAPLIRRVRQEQDAGRASGCVLVRLGLAAHGIP
jgi:hypothetical protein